MRPILHITYIRRSGFGHHLDLSLQVQEQILQFVLQRVIDHHVCERARRVLLVVSELRTPQWDTTVVSEMLNRETPLGLSCKQTMVLVFADFGFDAEPKSRKRESARQRTMLDDEDFW